MHAARIAFLTLLLVRASVDGVFEQSRLGEGGFSPGAILNIIIIGIFIFCVLNRRPSAFKIVGIVWAPYLSVAVISLSYTPDFAGGLRLFLSTTTLPAIFASTLILFKTPNQISLVGNVILLSSVPTSIISVYQITAFGVGERLSSTFNHPNVYAFYLIAVLVAYLSVLHFGERRTIVERWLLHGYAAFQASLLLLTQTRNAWFAAAVLLGVYAVGVNRRLLLVIPILPFILLLPPVAERIADVEEAQNVTIEEAQKGIVILNSYVWRQKLWESALDDSAESRLFGKGLNSFQINSSRFFPLIADTSIDAHSGYIQTLYENGIVGLSAYLLIFVSLIVYSIRSGRRRRQQMWILLAFIVVNVVINYADNIPYYLSYNWYAWALLGANLSYCLNPKSRGGEWQALVAPRLVRRISPIQNDGGFETQ